LFANCEFLMAQTRDESDGFPMAVLVEGGLALAAGFLAWLLNVSLRQQFPASGRPLAMAVARGVLVALPMLALFWILVRSDRPALRQLRQQVEWLVREMFPSGSIGQFGLVALLAGVGEELLFRGVVQTKLVEWTSPAVGLVFASLLFGAAHALSNLYFFLATAIGLYLGWFAQHYGELVTPIVAHALYDFLALVYLSRISQRRN
jgi:membrane protease YdiL (CAAX protease family)